MAGYAKVPNLLIKDVVDSHSLMNVNKETCDQYVNNFYKFVVVRHPLDRLVSAYMDKVHKYPLKGLKNTEPHYNWLRKKIYQYVHPDEYRKWYDKNGSLEIEISFVDFISYWLGTQGAQKDEHLIPIVDVCAPCHVRYHYYGNFETYEQDAAVLVQKVGATMGNLRRGFHILNPLETSTIATELYQELSQEQRIQVLEVLSKDIDFYYHLFPYKKDSHKHILNISRDLLSP